MLWLSAEGGVFEVFFFLPERIHRGGEELLELKFPVRLHQQPCVCVCSGTLEMTSCTGAPMSSVIRMLIGKSLLSRATPNILV